MLDARTLEFVRSMALSGEAPSKAMATLLGCSPELLRQTAHRYPELRSFTRREGRAVLWRISPVMGWWRANRSQQERL